MCSLFYRKTTRLDVSRRRGTTQHHRRGRPQRGFPPVFIFSFAHIKPRRKNVHLLLLVFQESSARGFLCIFFSGRPPESGVRKGLPVPPRHFFFLNASTSLLCTLSHGIHPKHMLEVQLVIRPYQAEFATASWSLFPQSKKFSISTNIFQQNTQPQAHPDPRFPLPPSSCKWCWFSAPPAPSKTEWPPDLHPTSEI